MYTGIHAGTCTCISLIKDMTTQKLTTNICHNHMQLNTVHVIILAMQQKIINYTKNKNCKIIKIFKTHQYLHCSCPSSDRY